jgi:hypothetical protein
LDRNVADLSADLPSHQLPFPICPKTGSGGCEPAHASFGCAQSCDGKVTPAAPWMGTVGKSRPKRLVRPYWCLTGQSNPPTSTTTTAPFRTTFPTSCMALGLFLTGICATARQPCPVCHSLGSPFPMLRPMFWPGRLSRSWEIASWWLRSVSVLGEPVRRLHGAPGDGARGCSVHRTGAGQRLEPGRVGGPGQA